MIGLAVKLCVSLGLHRRPDASSFDLGRELDKRLFWTCYALDRDINLSTGRPPTICDHDIDCPVRTPAASPHIIYFTLSIANHTDSVVKLPLEVNEDSINPQDFEAAFQMDPTASAPREPPTTLSHFLHVLRLKRIASEIQHAVYRVDKPVDNADSITNNFLAKLDDWKQSMPAERSRHNRLGEPNYELDTPSCQHWRDSYVSTSYSSQMVLLPSLWMIIFIYYTMDK